MKTLLKSVYAPILAIILMLAAVAIHTHKAHAAILGAPYLPEIDARFNALEGPAYINTNYPSIRTDSNAALHTAQATWDFAVQGGGPGTYNLGVSIPKNAIIVRSWIYSVAVPVTSASGQLAFKCENTGDIFPASASYPATGISQEGASTGTVANFKYIDAAASSCNIQAVISVGAFTAGKVTAFVEYTLHK